MKRRAVFLLMVAMPVGAQPVAPKTSPATASIEGDIYLLMKNGDVKRGASNTVYLVNIAPASLVSGTPAFKKRFAAACAFGDSLHHRVRVESDSIFALGKSAGANGRHGEAMKLIELSSDLFGKSLFTIQYAVDDSIRADLMRSAMATAKTGISGHYVFRNVTPGSYTLLAWTQIGDIRYRWEKRVVIRAGRTVADLDNDSAAKGLQFQCLD